MSNERSVGATHRRGRGLWTGIALAVIVVALVVWRTRAPQSGAKSGAAGGMAGMSMPTPSGGTIRLTNREIRDFGVTFDTARVRMLTNDVRAAGIVTVDSARLAQVTSRVGGYVERLYASTTGAVVARGQPVLTVYSPELLAAEQELLSARDLQRTSGALTIPGAAGPAPDLVAAAQRRLALLNVSPAQIAAVLRSGRAEQTVTLYAPVSGTILDKGVVQGQAIQPGMTLFTIADLATVWVDAELSEGAASLVRTGATATVRFAALPGRTFAARVAHVYPTLDSQSRTVRARLAVPNSGGALRPGMFATVALSSPVTRALTVPASAVLHTGTRDIVFVALGDGRLAPHEVTLGRAVGGLAEVLRGVEPGARVVTSAQYILDSESNLGEIMRGMIGQQ